MGEEKAFYEEKTDRSRRDTRQGQSIDDPRGKSRLLLSPVASFFSY